MDGCCVRGLWVMRSTSLHSSLNAHAGFGVAADVTRQAVSARTMSSFGVCSVARLRSLRIQRCDKLDIPTNQLQWIL